MRVFILTITTLFVLSSCQRKTIQQIEGEPNEKCEPVGSLEVILNEDDVWEITNDGKHFAYYPNQEEAVTTKFLLESYGVVESCSCGEGVLTNELGEENKNSEVMFYHLADGWDTFGRDGMGNNEENSYKNDAEDCLPFDPDKLVAKRSGGDWFLIERPGHSMFWFGNNKEACYDALRVIKKYGFNQSCFVGRAHPSFMYLKKYREDFDTIPRFVVQHGNVVVKQ